MNSFHRFCFSKKTSPLRTRKVLGRSSSSEKKEEFYLISGQFYIKDWAETQSEEEGPEPSVECERVFLQHVTVFLLAVFPFLQTVVETHVQHTSTQTHFLQGHTLADGTVGLVISNMR